MAEQHEPESITDPNEPITLLFNTLRTVSQNNVTYFSTDDSEYGKRLYTAFLNIIHYANVIEPKVKEINVLTDQYDFDEHTKGNGFRSFVAVILSSIKYTIQVSHKICTKRDTLLFRKSNVIREIESCSELLGSLDIGIQHVITLKNWTEPGDLFVSGDHSIHELLSMTSEINQYCFYGRCLGFQFCDSMKSILKFLSLTMAVFSEAYYNNGSFLYRATNSVWTSGKYVLDPDTRARRIVNISQNADVDFCKAYWFLAESEVMIRLPALFSASSIISHVISLPPAPLQYKRKDGTVIDIPIPSAHIGTQTLQVRLMSSLARQNMVGVPKNSKTPLAAKSTGLMVHCHGGGFVAQSSRSHEIYLRDWTYQLEIPILSVDYSLAPDAPFPRALEEVFYAYCWAVKNCELLGTTGENIILAGDSAGGNLCTGVAMKCIEYGMRPPNGIFLAYVPLLVEFVPSPSRLLCYMDPLLPFGFMMRCLKAYASTDSYKDANHQNGGALSSSDTESFEEVSESDLLELQAHKSPISETSDTLTNVSLSSQPMSTSSKPSENTVTELKMDDKDKGESQKYVDEFLEKYVLESDTDSDGVKVQVLQSNKAQSGQQKVPAFTEQSIQQKITGFMGALTERITRWKNKKHVTAAELYLDGDRQKSLLEEFIFTVPRDPYLSPYFADDEILKQLPPIRLVTVELDPCLDDCVMFAKKLKKLNSNVGLDVLSGLPHGFLNFSMLCKEAHQGSKKCVERMNELLNLQSSSTQQT